MSNAWKFFNLSKEDPGYAIRSLCNNFTKKSNANLYSISSLLKNLNSIKLSVKEKFQRLENHHHHHLIKQSAIVRPQLQNKGSYQQSTKLVSRIIALLNNGK